MTGGERRNWWRFGLLVIITAITLVPFGGVLAGALGLTDGGPANAATWLRDVGRSVVSTLQGQSLYWFENSLGLAFGAVLVCILVGAPAGYALARSRGRAISGYSLGVFLLQSFPPVLLLVPIFLVFARRQLVDNLFGLGLVYIALTLSFAIWMFAAYTGTVPVELEEAAWLDGCSVFGAYVRIVVRICLPAILTTSIFTFLSVWNDYLAAFTFVRSQANYTLGIGLQAAGHSPILAILVAVPPLLIFVLLNRFFSVVGIAGALGAR